VFIVSIDIIIGRLKNKVLNPMRINSKRMARRMSDTNVAKMMAEKAKGKIFLEKRWVFIV
jgi:hypothetical protein